MLILPVAWQSWTNQNSIELAFLLLDAHGTPHGDEQAARCSNAH
jgi:hypothetical protein